MPPYPALSGLAEQRTGLPTPCVASLYQVIRNHENGRRPSTRTSWFPAAAPHAYPVRWRGVPVHPRRENRKVSQLLERWV